MKGLTKRQRDVLDFLQEYISRNRHSPSYRDIQQHFGLSSLGSVYKHLHALMRKGYVTAEPGASRSIKLLEQPVDTSQHIQVPLMGHLSAGYPIETLSHAQTVSIPASLVTRPDTAYALRVRGDSLNEELIADGDLVLVEASLEAQPGEMVIILINGHDTLIKRYYPNGAYVRLDSHSPLLQPMMLRHSDVTIQGVVVAVLRTYPKPT